jgi:hypothetical protein
MPMAAHAHTSFDSYIKIGDSTMPFRAYGINNDTDKNVLVMGVMAIGSVEQ